MRKNLIILLLASIGLYSCGDDDSYTENNKILLTPQKLAGTWELFNFEKTLNGAGALRYIEGDGAKITFDQDGKFYESDALDNRWFNGTYKVLSNGSTIEFKGKSILTGNDTTTTTDVHNIDNERLTTIVNYDYYGRRITDIRVFRNKATTPPNYHPKVEKFDITLNDILGDWVIVKYAEVRNSATINTTRGLGVTWRYNADSSFVKLDSKGEFAREGVFVIVDDVIRRFFVKIKDENEKLKSSSAHLIAPSSIWNKGIVATHWTDFTPYSTRATSPEEKDNAENTFAVKVKSIEKNKEGIIEMTLSDNSYVINEITKGVDVVDETIVLHKK